MGKYFPLNHEQLENLAKEFPTPFYLYDEKAIRENARRFIKAFDIFPFFREYFAVKACPNPYILKILKNEGFGADCSSLAELALCEKCGILGGNIMFTSNDTPKKEFTFAAKLGAIINLDDITHIDFLEDALGGVLPEIICFRYNPGSLKKGGNAIIGKCEEAKYGLTRDQMLEAYSICKKRGVKHFGIHTMVASNELNEEFFWDTARIVFELAAEAKQRCGVRIEFADLGGGIGIPYRPEQTAPDYNKIARGIKEEYDKILSPAGLTPMKIYFECGRPITGPYGYLVTRAIHEKHIYRDYIGVDASMADLMRPGMYGAYHEIIVSGKENAEKDRVYDVTGSLCENCDKFAVQRPFPEINTGDLLVICDAGAHGRAMGFNYNGKLRAKEVLMREDGSFALIRRAETLEDYFATIDFSGLESFSESSITGKGAGNAES